MSTYLGIFGNGSPKIVTQAAAEITLDNIIVHREEPIENNESWVSDIDQRTVYLTRPFNWVFECSILIFKDGFPTADRMAYFYSLLALRGQTVTYYPFRDYVPMKDENGDEVPFEVARVVPYYFGERWKFKNAIILELRSTVPVDLVQSSTGYVLNDDGYPVLNDDGKPILTD